MMKKTLFLWMFILLSLGLFLFYSFKSSAAESAFPVPLFAKIKETNEYEKGKIAVAYTYFPAKEENGPSPVYLMKIAEQGWHHLEQTGLAGTYEKNGKTVTLIYGTGELTVIQE
ncbi:hypothetical protein BGLY_2151 [Bacillus glycinifermentans]|nr:hypothetical protein BGLY_2151 [Bacillus glycinifermentans]